MIKLNLQDVRQMLEEERMQLLDLIAGGVGSNGREAINPDRSDLAQDYTAHERDTALLQVEQEQVAQIEAALQRLDQGTYGVCAICNQAIAPERLQALPYATLCIGCQAQREHQKW